MAALCGAVPSPMMRGGDGPRPVRRNMVWYDGPRPVKREYIMGEAPENRFGTFILSTNIWSKSEVTYFRATEIPCGSSAEIKAGAEFTVKSADSLYGSIIVLFVLRPMHGQISFLLFSCWRDLHIDAGVEVEIMCSTFDVKCSDSNSLSWMVAGSENGKNYCDTIPKPVKIPSATVSFTVYLDYNTNGDPAGSMTCTSVLHSFIYSPSYVSPPQQKNPQNCYIMYFCL